MYARFERLTSLPVLLRVLEYYEGILILTTNRIKTFDIADQSRVNFAINYQKLTDTQKKSIYRHFIRQLTEDEVQDKQTLLDWPNIEDWVEANFDMLNGRQIRNVLFSAVSNAQSERNDKRLTMGHIKRILKETNQFENDTRNMLENARAAAEVGFDKR